MLKSELLAALRTEIHKHDFSHFVYEPPSIAQGGNGRRCTGLSDVQEKIWNDATISRSFDG
jgi:hypothetical protein